MVQDIHDTSCMAVTSMMMDCSSKEWHAGEGNSDGNGKYVRYTDEQIKVMEKLYNECPKPSSLRRQQLIRDQPILRNIEPKQIKVWFQNRRCREKQRKETYRLQNVNGKLTAMNKLLMDENDRLQKQITQLLYDNGYLRQQLPTNVITTDTSCDSVVTSSLQHLQTHQQSQNDANLAGILSLAQETLAELLSKATGTSVDWIPLPGMKPGPDSTTSVNISLRPSGVAARVCGIISLPPLKVAEIIKDRPSWQHNCRCLQRLFMSSTGNGGVLEVLYVQMYAPTTLAAARDFYTLRYTSLLQDGSYVICEKSLNSTYGMPTAPDLESFIRAEMHSSGCLIRPHAGTGSMVVLVDHMDLQAWSVPEVLRSIYESSSILAHNLTLDTMRHLQYQAEEAGCESNSGRQQHATVCLMKWRLARGFNNALNGFDDDGWCTIASDDGIIDDIVTISVKTEPTSKDVGVLPVASLSGGILCAKASMLLQNVPPQLVLRFLREHRSDWDDLDVEFDPAIPFKTNGFLFNSQILHQTEDKDEILELVKVEGNGSAPRDMLLLQLCRGLDDNSANGAYAEMLFAPIHDSISHEAPLLPSGFRIIPLHNRSFVGNSPKQTLDLASTLEVGSGGSANESANLGCVLTLAFQFTFENHLRDSVAALARQYIRKIMYRVQHVALAAWRASACCVNKGSPLE